MPRRKKITIDVPDQLETLAHAPSKLAKAGILRTGAGPHGERRKKNRRKDRQEERDALYQQED